MVLTIESFSPKTTHRSHLTLEALILSICLYVCLFFPLGSRCDRILWYGKGLKQLSYTRAESRHSDHRPVAALFAVEIELAKRHPDLLGT
jgi:hypothetical protein